MIASKRNLLAGVCALWLAAALLSPRAAGQETLSTTHAVVVCNTDNPLRTVLASMGYTLFATTIDAGETLVNDNWNSGEIWTLVVVRQTTATNTTPVAWTLTKAIELSSTGISRIIGYPREAPEDVIIDGPGSGPVIEILDGASSAVIEGVTLTGAEYGIRANGDSSAKIQRCYIRENSSDGIRCEGFAKLWVENCSIYKNGGDGVYADTSTGVGTETNIATFDFDDVTLPTDWTMDSACEWAYGAPNGSNDPPTAHTGANVLGMNLSADRNGDYQSTAIGTKLVPVTLPTVTSTIDFTDAFTIGDVNVEINLSKTTPASPLRAELTAPGGTAVTLFVGLPVDTAGLSGTLLDDEATTPILNGAAGFAGSFRPQNILSAFDAGTVTGTWTLVVTDASGGDITLDSWRLIVTPRTTPFYVVSSEINCADYSNPQLKFWSWTNIDKAVIASIDVSTDGSSVAMADKRWARLWDNKKANVTEGAWTEKTYNRLAVWAARKPAVYIRWGYQIQEGASPDWCLPGSGWNIDDVRVVDVAAPSGRVHMNHCSIIENSGSGVRANSSDDVTVTNSLVYKNAGAGGLVNVVPGDNFYEAYNFVKGNTPDYVHVDMDDTSDFSETDPGLDESADWKGKLLLTSPLLGKAGGNVAYDLEYERRPSSGSQDIGADEVGGNTGISAWLSCFVDPPIVGRAGTGALTVIIEVDGEWDDLNDIAYIAPQGVDGGAVDLSNPNAPIISLDRDSALSTNRVLVFHNADEITTSISRRNNVPDAGDILADGHAAVFLRVNNTVLGDQASDPIEPAAKAGRHLLIDTVPPRIELIVADAPSVEDFVILNNASPFAAGVSWGSALHPYDAPPGTYAQVGGADLAAAWRATTALNTSGEPMVFFNVGSESNNYVSVDHDGLKLILAARFVDPDVFTEYGLAGRPSAALDTDYAVNSHPTHRQVAGFLGVTVDVTPGVAADVFQGRAEFTDTLSVDHTDVEAALPVRWRVSGGSQAILQDADAGLVLAVGDSGGNAGFFGSGEVGGNILGALYDEVQSATWSFDDLGGAFIGNGIPTDANPGWVHLIGVFEALDRAGNVSTARPSDPANRPLHVWWLLGEPSDMRLDVKSNAQPGIWPAVEWAFQRGYSQQLQIDPASKLGPVYAHAVWMSTAEGKDGKDAPYTKIKDWTWGTASRLAPADFDAISGVNKDRWILVTLCAIDEAGNVKPWRDNGLTFNGSNDIVVAGTGDKGENWVRFYAPGDPSQLDTTMTADVFYYDVATFDPADRSTWPQGLGPVPMVSYPKTDPLQTNTAVGVTFTIRPYFPEATANGGVEIELLRDGVTVFKWEPGPGESLAAGASVTWTFPTCVSEGSIYVGGFSPWVDGTNRPRLGRYAPPAKEGEIAQAKIANYVFRATTVVQTTTQLRDPTPAQFSFKLVPGDISQYIESGKEQPIKVHESR